MKRILIALAVSVSSVVLSISSLTMSLSSVAQAQPAIDALRPWVESSCIFCLLRFDQDISGCESVNDPDPDAEACRRWAVAELRRCTRGCWTDSDLPSLLFVLWDEGRITSDELVALLMECC